MKISAINELLKNVYQAKEIAESMQSMAQINLNKMFHKKKKFDLFLKKIRSFITTLPEGLIEKYKGQKYTVFLGSDFGFCGGYNGKIKEAMLSTEGDRIVLGKKLGGPNNAISSIKKSFLRNINVDVVFFDGMETKRVSFYDWFKEGEEDLKPGILEIDENFFVCLVSIFLEHNMTEAAIGENLSRLRAMDRAIDNIKKQAKDLTLETNKMRQELITSELQIISAALES